jgi:hypothetical protein
VPPRAPMTSHGQLQCLGTQRHWGGGVHKRVDLLCIIPEASSWKHAMDITYWDSALADRMKDFLKGSQGGGHILQTGEGTSRLHASVMLTLVSVYDVKALPGQAYIIAIVAQGENSSGQLSHLSPLTHRMLFHIQGKSQGSRILFPNFLKHKSWNTTTLHKSPPLLNC